VIAALGYLGILVALGSASLLAVAGWRTARRPELGAAGLRLPVAGLVAGALVAFLALEAGVLLHDFSIAYVARNTARATPFVFLLAAGWAALQGSVVLWGIVLAAFTWLVARRVGDGDGLGAGALGILGLVAVFWFGLMATAANPFALCTSVAGGVCSGSSWLPLGAAVAPPDGLGPNPLLQNNILMAVHPPMLYLGYVGFTVPYAFAMAALLRGDQGRVWLERTHRWSVVAWGFLGLGILLGGWWSYEVLGWGGYWAWDPVENAAFLPWLVGTAFIHSALVQRRRGMLQAWNFVLVIGTFALTILGTFLTRSGVIASVHSFSQSAVGPILLAFLFLVTVGSLGIFAARAHLVASSPRLDSLVSREGFLLLNNLVLTLFAFTVLVGTLYPMVLQAVSGREVSVGRPFFDRISLPLAFTLLLAVGLGSVAPWRVARLEVLWSRVRLGVTVGAAAAAATVVVGVRSVPVVIVAGLAGFIVGTILGFFLTQVRRRRGAGESWGVAALTVVRNDMGYWGGQVSHVGLALLALAIATTSALAVRQQVRLAVGETALVHGYCIRYEGVERRAFPNRVADVSRFTLLGSDCRTAIAELEPHVNAYPNATQRIATPAVRTGLVEDVYLSLAGGTEERVALDVFVFPLQWLVWAGGAIVVAGGVMALGRGRRRRRRDEAPGTGAREEARV